MKIELVALLLLPFGCLVTVNVLWLFLREAWVGLHCVIVVFPYLTHLLFVKSMFVFAYSKTDFLTLLAYISTFLTLIYIKSLYPQNSVFHKYEFNPHLIPMF